jgi:hypothetical protein
MHYISTPKSIHFIHKKLTTTISSGLVKALGRCTPEFRCMVPTRYEQMYEKNLQAVIKSECGNRDLGTALQFLAVDPVEAECDMIDIACKGFGTDEMLLLTIICGRSNKEIDILKVRNRTSTVRVEAPFSLFSYQALHFGFLICGGN